MAQHDSLGLTRRSTRVNEVTALPWLLVLNSFVDDSIANFTSALAHDLGPRIDRDFFCLRQRNHFIWCEALAKQYASFDPQLDKLFVVT